MINADLSSYDIRYLGATAIRLFFEKKGNDLPTVTVNGNPAEWTANKNKQNEIVNYYIEFSCSSAQAIFNDNTIKFNGNDPGFTYNAANYYNAIVGSATYEQKYQTVMQKMYLYSDAAKAIQSNNS